MCNFISYFGLFLTIYLLFSDTSLLATHIMELSGLPGDGQLSVVSPHKAAHLQLQYSIFSPNSEELSASSVALGNTQPSSSSSSSTERRIDENDNNPSSLTAGLASGGTSIPSSNMQPQMSLDYIAFSFEELHSSQILLQRLKGKKNHEIVVDAIIKRVMGGSANSLMISHALRNLYESTHHIKFGQQLIDHYNKRLSTPKGLVRLWDCDVDILTSILQHSSELRPAVFKLALAENGFSSWLNHSRRIKLQEKMVEYALTERDKDTLLDQICYDYVDLLNTRYEFRLEDQGFLTRLAKNYPFFRSTFLAILTYSQQRQSTYFLGEAKKVLSITECEDYQREVDNCLAFIMNNRVIPAGCISYIKQTYSLIKDPEARRNLLLLQSFMEKWFSLALDGGSLQVPVPESLYKNNDLDEEETVHE